MILKNRLDGLAPLLRPKSGRAVFKRLFDMTAAAVFLLAAWPVFPVVALAIRLDSPGPAFFRQQRCGLGGRMFTIYKFRTMRADQCDAAGGPQATRNDPRVTRVGRFLRRTSLDELPQVWNILRGEMSWVGPRPHAVEHARHFAQTVPNYLRRYAVKPGLTGWAQVNGQRGETPRTEQIHSRIRYDLDYIRRQSLAMDLRILLMTFGVLMHRSAY